MNLRLSMFTPPTIEDFERFFDARKGWRLLDNGPEVIYEWAIPSFPGAKVRVFTSISARTLRSRPYGTDAIRVVAIHQGETTVGLVKASVIRRTPGWRTALQREVYRVISLAKSRKHLIKDNYVAR